MGIIIATTPKANLGSSASGGLEAQVAVKDFADSEQGLSWG